METRERFTSMIKRVKRTNFTARRSQARARQPGYREMLKKRISAKPARPIRYVLNEKNSYTIFCTSIIPLRYIFNVIIFFFIQVSDEIHELMTGLSNISIERYRRQALGNYSIQLICTRCLSCRIRQKSASSRIVPKNLEGTKQRRANVPTAITATALGILRPSRRLVTRARIKMSKVYHYYFYCLILTDCRKR